MGIGRITRGYFDDEDYRAGQVKFSDTTSSMRDGRIGYGMIDLGHHWVLREGAISLGVFGGLSQWTEEYHAYGAEDHLGFIGGDIDNSINVISNKVRWRALRVGFSGQFVLGRVRVGVDVAAVPYAKFYNEDSHHLRAQPVGSSPFALGPVPNIIDEGEGFGVQSDLELRYEIARRTELGVGLRYWYLKAREGTTDFTNFANGETPIVEFKYGAHRGYGEPAAHLVAIRACARSSAHPAGAQRAHDAREVLAVPHFQDEMHRGKHGAVVPHGDGIDVRARVGDLGSHLGEHPALVLHRDVDRRLEQARGARVPLHVDPLLRLVLARAQAGDAVGAVHHQPLALLDPADDRIARNRPAAGGELYRHPFGAGGS